MDKNITINITSGTIIKSIFIIFLAVAFYLIRDLILVVLISVVLASGVEIFAVRLQRIKIPRTLAVILVYFLFFVLLGTIFYFVVPPVFSELSSLASRTSTGVGQSFPFEAIDKIILGAPSDISAMLSTLSTQAANYINKFTSGFLNAAASIFGGAYSFVLIVIISFYLSVQEHGIEDFLRMVSPVEREEYIVDLWSRTRKKIGLWFQGEILLGAIVGILSFLGLTIIGMDYALTFALLAGALELVPFFGPTLSAIPPILMALSISPIMALKVLVLYIIIQQFENNLIYPLVVRKIVGISPIIAILALIVGARLGGFMGVLLSVPLATALVEILNDFEIKKHGVAKHGLSGEIVS